MKTVESLIEKLETQQKPPTPPHQTVPAQSPDSTLQSGKTHRPSLSSSSESSSLSDLSDQQSAKESEDIQELQNEYQAMNEQSWQDGPEPVLKIPKQCYKINERNWRLLLKRTPQSVEPIALTQQEQYRQLERLKSYCNDKPEKEHNLTKREQKLILNAMQQSQHHTQEREFMDSCYQQYRDDGGKKSFKKLKEKMERDLMHVISMIKIHDQRQEELMLKKFEHTKLQQEVKQEEQC